MTTPEARCGECPNCKYVEATRKIIMAELTQQHATDATVQMWNNALQNSPCIRAMVWVTTDNNVKLKGRIIPQPHGQTREDGMVHVLTIERGELRVPESKVDPWSPEVTSRQLGYSDLTREIQAAPDTWIAALYTVIRDEAVNRKVFVTPPADESTGIAAG